MALSSFKCFHHELNLLDCFQQPVQSQRCQFLNDGLELASHVNLKFAEGVMVEQVIRAHLDHQITDSKRREVTSLVLNLFVRDYWVSCLRDRLNFRSQYFHWILTQDLNWDFDRIDFVRLVSKVAFIQVVQRVNLRGHQASDLKVILDSTMMLKLELAIKSWATIAEAIIMLPTISWYAELITSFVILEVHQAILELRAIELIGWLSHLLFLANQGAPRSSNDEH